MSNKVRGTINLVEIIAVLLVVGIFMTLIIPKLGYERRMEIKCRHNLELIARAESLYFDKDSVYTDDFEDLKEFIEDIDKINFCPLDSAPYVLKFKKDTFDVDPNMPESLMYELDFTDTTKTKYVELNKKVYILQCVYGHGKIINGKKDWEENKE